MSSKKPQSAQQLAHRLIASRRSEGAGKSSAASAAAAACDHLYRELSRWVGSDGCHALFARAVARARLENPALERLQRRARSEPYLAGVAETIATHGDAPTAKALESMLVLLLELLGRLIGDDMAMKLIERSLSASGARNATFDDKQEEA